MRVLICSLVSAGLMAGALSQTPPGTQPSTNNTLAVSYGNTKVTPGIDLPLSVPKTVPTINYPSSTNQTYQLLLVDLSISIATLNTSTLVPAVQLPLTVGTSKDRTTRLHYWQTGLTFSPTGTLTNTTAPIAFYQPPAPPPGDIAHTYVFYLFEQEDGFAPPPAGNPFSEALVNKGSNRMSFNVNHLAGESGVGPLVAANYFVAQNSSGNSQTSGSATGTVTSPTTVPFMGNANQRSLGVTGVLITVGAMAFMFMRGV